MLRWNATDKKFDCVSVAKELKLKRYLFTSDTTWTVPDTTKSAFVTMAGGGGSGHGWRFSNHIASGHSGGYLFSAPVAFAPGETINIIVGKGGKGYSPVPNGPAPIGSIMIPPSGDNGLGGYPGTSSKIVSPSLGTVLECAGGSGSARTLGLDDYGGSLVAGGLTGAQTGSGAETIATPNRPAAGPYSGGANAPGKCGGISATGDGIGNSGNYAFSAHGTALPIVSLAGGATPFGYGSGGSVSPWGCYVTATANGLCITAADGRDGVVMIDTLE